MRIDDFFDNRKSKSSTFAVFSAGGVNLVETVPDLVETFFRVPVPWSLTDTKTLPFLTVVSIWMRNCHC